MRLRFTILFFLLISLVSGFSNEEDDLNAVLERVGSCIASGSSDCLSPYLSERTELTLLNTRGDYGRSQAKFVLQKFFDQNRPLNFKIVKTGMSGGSIYALGEYRSSKGLLEANIYLKQDSQGRYRVEKLRFAEK